MIGQRRGLRRIIKTKHRYWKWTWRTKYKEWGSLEGLWGFVKKFILIHAVCLSCCEDILANTDRMRWILLSRTSKPKRVCNETPLSCTLQKSVAFLCVSQDESNSVLIGWYCWGLTQMDHHEELKALLDQAGAWKTTRRSSSDCMLSLQCLSSTIAICFGDGWNSKGIRNAQICQGSWPARTFGILGPFCAETNTALKKGDLQHWENSFHLVSEFV